MPNDLETVCVSHQLPNLNELLSLTTLHYALTDNGNMISQEPLGVLHGDKTQTQGWQPTVTVLCIPFA